jgi:hypothetical protein
VNDVEINYLPRYSFSGKDGLKNNKLVMDPEK